MKRLNQLFFTLLVYILPLSVFSQTGVYHDVIPEVPKQAGLVFDYAHMLTPEQTLNIENQLVQFEKQTSNEITLITVDTLGGLDVSEFANEIGRKWNIGKESKKNGLILLASLKDRKVNISPGYGLSGALPDVICNRIIRENIVPHFKSQNYYQGFSEAISRIMDATQGEFVNENAGNDSGTSIPFWVVLLFFIGLFFFISYLRRKSKNIYVSRRGYKYDSNTWWNLPSSGGGILNSGGWDFGGGSSHSSGGGFGGFGGGGGGFDGGGSSGSW